MIFAISRFNLKVANVAILGKAAFARQYRIKKLILDRMKSKTAATTITPQELLFSQGFGSRHECTGTVVNGKFEFNGTLVTDPFEDLAIFEAAPYKVAGKPWQYHTKAYLVLHKPAGYECSKKPKHHPSAYSLLPAELRVRDVQAVGRLDEDTTGLLLFSDDGQFIHRVTSPKHKAAKIYVATLKHPADDSLCQKLLQGVILNDSPKPVLALGARLLNETTLELTLSEGKYHQVKRMVAAVSNRVEALHRNAIGEHQLRANCAEGEWYWLTAEELAQIW
jgi:16S rRNA pseudouridine516 synthase